MTIGRSSLDWKNNKLYHGSEDTGISVFQWPDEKYVHFKIRYPDGEISEDFYNLTRAKDNSVKYYLAIHNEGIRNLPASLTDAFSTSLGT